MQKSVDEKCVCHCTGCNIPIPLLGISVLQLFDKVGKLLVSTQFFTMSLRQFEGNYYCVGDRP